MRDQYVVTAIVVPDEDQFTALCLDFDIAAPGKTEKIALEELGRLVTSFLSYADAEGLADFSRPVPVSAVRELVASEDKPTPDHPVRRKAEVVSFIPAHA